jgi:molybdopterin-guanine dinucleotide biosynthesis protein B
VKVLAVTGWSNSGKTTLIVDLIQHLVARGDRVAAIKHTHHAVNDRDEGDTARFRAAGASPVILAGDNEVVQWRTGAPPVRIPRGTGEGARPPLDLLNAIANADVVLIEGFKSYDGWRRIEATAGVAEALMILDRIDDP